MPEVTVSLVSGIVLAVIVVASLGCVGLSDEDLEQLDDLA